MHRDVDEQHHLAEDEVIESKLLKHLEANYILTALYLIVNVCRLQESTDQQQQVRDAAGG